MSFGWEGKLVRLVPLDERHFDNALRWINDSEITAWLLVGDYPTTRIAEREWFDGASKSSESNIIFAIETLDGRHVGMSGIHQLDRGNGTAVTGSFIGNPQDWGKGFGTDAALTRARYCFEVLGLRLLMTSFLEGNERSMRMSTRVGFREIGRWPKKYWKRGQFRDEILLALDRDSFFAQHG
ncbi:MAG: hypothetical protein HONBIEJF_00348 [Fimbriimonadaceae bacterium]|nr:hypothetical protein [Fimbriimonadaceae bacterium]